MKNMLLMTRSMVQLSLSFSLYSLIFSLSLSLYFSLSLYLYLSPCVSFVYFSCFNMQNKGVFLLIKRKIRINSKLANIAKKRD